MVLSPLFIAGHRGLGATDSALARIHAQSVNKPPENTIASIKEALKLGADMIEIDVMLSKDNQVVVTHSNRLDDHVFSTKNNGYVDDLTYAEIASLLCGYNHQGRIPLLKEVLALILPSNALLNIELKDVKGTERLKNHDEETSLIKHVLAEVKNGFDYQRVIYSSFSEEDLRQLKSLDREAKRAILFDRLKDEEQRIYPHDDVDQSCYLQCTEKNIVRLHEEIGMHFIHPELKGITVEALSVIKEYGVGINSWSHHELLPSQNAEAIEHYSNLLSQFNMKGGIITDHLREMKAFLLTMEDGAV